MKSKIDPRLVEIFEYNLGVDLTDPKHQGFLYELADYFKAVAGKAITDFHALQYPPPNLAPQDPISTKKEVK